MCLSFRQFIEYFPELRTVVHLSSMDQFVQKYIVHKVRWKQHQVTGQVDAACSGTASPSAFASRYLDSLVFESVVLGQFIEEWWKIGLCAFLQGADDGIAKQLLYGLLDKIYVGRTENGDAFLIGANHKAGELSLFHLQAETRSVDAEVQVQGLWGNLLPAFQQSGAELLDSSQAFARLAVRRYSDVKSVGLGAHADVARRDSGADDDLSEVLVGDDSLGCHR